MKTSSGTLPSAFRISMGLLSAGIVLIFGAWFILANHAYAATLVQSATASKLSNQASPTVVTAIFPTAATAGHLLIAVVGARGTATITGPATWTSAINQSGNPSQAIFYKIASGGETDVTATVNANPGSIGLALFEYAGSEVTLAQTSSSTGNNATPGSGSITTSDANELVLAAFTLANNKAITDTSWNDAGEGFTELTDIGTTGPGRAAEYATGNNLANGIGPHSVIVASAGPANWRGQIVGFRVRAFATNVTSSLANGSYAVGQVVPVQMTFNRAVTVDTSGGTPDLHLNNGGNALYASGSGTATLTFNYTVGDGEDVADLDYGSTSALQLSGGVVQDDAHNDISLALPALGGAGSLAANKNIAINTTVPSFTMQYYSDSGLTQSLGSTPRLKAGTYYLAVTADEALNAVPTVSLAAEGTANDVTGAAMTLVSGTTYRYARTVSFDASAVGSVLESVSVTGSDLAGNTSTGAHPANMATAAAYTDTVAPDVPTVAAIAGDNYIKNDEKNAILVTGTAEAGSLVSITLSDGSNSTTGTQQLGSASTDFSLTLDGTAASPSPLADGTITPSVTATDAAGNASVATTTPTATQDSVAPSLTAVRVASNNADPTKAKPGDTVTLTITGNEPLRSPAVIFHGAPIDMTGSGADWTANRVMTTADTEGPITFSVSYFDAAGNTGPPVAATTDGSSVTYDRTPPSVAEVTPVATPSSNGSPSYTFSSTEAGSIAYGGSCTSATADAAVGNNTVTFGPYGSDGTHADCTIRVTDQAGNMSATLNVSSFTTDISDPAVTEVASDAADGTYGLNALIEIHVLFNENVFVTGSPSIALNASGGAVAPYLGGSGTSMLEFLYAVQSGDASSDLDYASTDALALNGGTIRDSVDRNAALLLPSPGSAGSLGANKNIVIDAVPPDTTQPNVSGVSSASPSGTYGAGASIPIHVQFDENVAVTGTPQLNLNVGGGGYSIDYQSGSGTGTLVFAYTVRPGDDTTLLDYVDANALTLNGGSIKDTDGNDALLALPSPGTGGSLGGHNAIVIRTVPPHLAEVTPVGTYTANQTPSYAFSSDVAGTIVYGGSCGSPTVDAESGDNTVVFNALAEGTYGDCTITVTDAAGNVSDPLAVSSFTVDLHPPLILSTSPLNGSVGQNRSSVVTLSFTKALDPSTFGIADDNSNRYGTPVWNAGDTEVAISHATWTQGTLVTITVDASTVGGEPLNAPTSWSFTTAGQSHGSANPPVQPPETASIVCSFLPFDEIVQSPGETVSIGWTASGLGVGGTLLSYSTDDRKTWNTLAANGLNNTTYAWTVPQADGPVFLRLDCRDSGGAVLGSTEGLFSVRTETEVPEPTASESPPPAPASAYSPEANRTEAPTIGDDKSLDARVAANACSGAELLKTKTRSTVYYCGRDGTRYPFPDEPTYFSWYVGFENVRVIGDADMAAIPLGSNVTHRPGGRMVKLIGNDKVFAVSKGAVLHWLVSEDAAARAYGPHWNELIDDLPNDLFGDYTMGEPIQ